MSNYRDPYIYDGVGRNPYDLYDGGDIKEADEDWRDPALFPKYVEVVYCIDCKYRALPFEESPMCRWSENDTPCDWDYCSYGEKTDGTKATPL